MDMYDIGEAPVGAPVDRRILELERLIDAKLEEGETEFTVIDPYLSQEDLDFLRDRYEVSRPVAVTFTHHEGALRCYFD